MIFRCQMMRRHRGHSHAKQMPESAIHQQDITRGITTKRKDMEKTTNDLQEHRSDGFANRMPKFLGNQHCNHILSQAKTCTGHRLISCTHSSTVCITQANKMHIAQNTQPESLQVTQTTKCAEHRLTTTKTHNIKICC